MIVLEIDFAPFAGAWIETCTMRGCGQSPTGRLLIIGAMSRLNWMGRKKVIEGSWLARMLTKKPRMLVTIALANKMARRIWAMLTKRENYRDSVQVAATLST